MTEVTDAQDPVSVPREAREAKDIVFRLFRAAGLVYLAAEESVANDLNALLGEAGHEIERLRLSASPPPTPDTSGTWNEAVEASAKAVCLWCEREMPVSKTNAYYHDDEGLSVSCDAWAIRALRKGERT